MPRSIDGCVLFAALVGFGACSVNQTGLGGAAGSSSSAGAGGVAASGATGGNSPAGGVGGGAGRGGAGGSAAAGGVGGAAGTGMAGEGAAGRGTAGTGAAGAGAAGTGGDAGAAGTGAGGVSGSSGGDHGDDSCDASSCPNGCCRNGQCVTDRNDQACGNGGVMCSPCGDCLRCGSVGACELDPSSKWKVTCVSAKVSATKANGQVWDPAYSSPPQSNADPYCRLDTEDGRSRSSPIVMDTLTPVWNADVTPTSGGGLTASLLLEQGLWMITVLDDDPAVPTAETICRVTPQLSATTLASGMLEFSNVGSCTDLTLTVACVQ